MRATVDAWDAYDLIQNSGEGRREILIPRPSRRSLNELGLYEISQCEILGAHALNLLVPVLECQHECPFSDSR